MSKVLSILALFSIFPQSAFCETSREQQSIIAKWTAQNICKMGVEEFYSINGNQMKELFENQTSMKYEDIPINPTESERNKITSQLTGCRRHRLTNLRTTETLKANSAILQS